jgi:hypothetical protein
MRNAANRRGLAMMMVLVSLALATILSTAYLTSRDNSLAIGLNSTAAARARWAALSALEMAVAVLQTETDWRNNHTNGVLLDSYPLAGATITITVRDMETDAPPTDTSEYLELTATASVDIDNDGRADGVQETKIEAYVPRVAGNRVAIDLAEFAIFVEDDIILNDSATVARWATAPLSGLGRRIQLGTQASASSSVDVRDTAVCIDTTVYYQTGASSSPTRPAPPSSRSISRFGSPCGPGRGRAYPTPAARPRPTSCRTPVTPSRSPVTSASMKSSWKKRSSRSRVISRSCVMTCSRLTISQRSTSTATSP